MRFLARGTMFLSSAYLLPKVELLFFFKLDGTAAEVLLQIHDKGYARAYAADERKKFLLGISFSSKTGTTEKWQEESL